MELKGSWDNGAPLDPWMLRRTYLLEFKPDAWASSVTRITDELVKSSEPWTPPLHHIPKQYRL